MTSAVGVLRGMDEKIAGVRDASNEMVSVYSMGSKSLSVQAPPAWQGVGHGRDRRESIPPWGPPRARYARWTTSSICSEEIPACWARQSSASAEADPSAVSGSEMDCPVRKVGQDVEGHGIKRTGGRERGRRRPKRDGGLESRLPTGIRHASDRPDHRRLGRDGWTIRVRVVRNSNCVESQAVEVGRCSAGSQ